MKRYRFLSIFDTESSTDGAIISGIKKLLRYVFDDFEVKSVIPNKTIEFKGKKIKICEFFKFDENDITYEMLYKDDEFDLIIVPGTPWIWDQFYKSPKYRNLIKLIEIHKNTPIIFFGIGSCVSKGNISSLFRPEEQKHIRYLFSKGMVIVRDSLTYSALTNAGVDAYLLPCPSFFAAEKIRNKNNSISFVFLDPLTTITAIDWIEKKYQYENLKNTIEKVMEEIFKNNGKNYIAIHSKKNLEKSINYIKTYSLDIIEDIYQTIKLAENSLLITMRVHCGAFAHSSQTKTAIIPIDSRALTLTDFGCFEINSFEDFKYFIKNYENRFDDNIRYYYLNKYIELLTHIKKKIDSKNLAQV